MLRKLPGCCSLIGQFTAGVMFLYVRGKCHRLENNLKDYDNKHTCDSYREHKNLLSPIGFLCVGPSSNKYLFELGPNYI